MNKLLKLKNEYKKLAKIFVFLDFLTSKIVKVSTFNLNRDSIIFIDYKTNNHYYVNFEKANKIIKQSQEFFIMSMLENLINLEIFELMKKKKEFPFFFFNLFITFKNGIVRGLKIDKEFIYNSMIYLNNNGSLKSDSEYHSNLILFIEHSNIDFLCSQYLLFKDLSYENCSFLRENGECYPRFKQYDDMIFMLKYNKNFYNYNDLEIFDICLQKSILMCFKGANYALNIKSYNDNILIRNRSYTCKEFPEIEKNAYVSTVYKKSSQS